MPSFTTVLSAAVLAGMAIAGFGKAGCVSPDFVNSMYKPADYPLWENAITGPDHPADSYTGCPTSCMALKELMAIGQGPPGRYGTITLSAFKPGVGGAPGECYCLDFQEARRSAEFIVLGDGPYGDCFPETFELLDINPNNPRLISCIKEIPWPWGGGEAVGPWGASSTPDTCFDSSRREVRSEEWPELYLPYMFLYPLPEGQVSKEWLCMLGPSVGDTVQATCGPGVGRLYALEDAPSPSFLARKRTLAARAKTRAELATFRDCPRGFDACSIPGFGSAYECLDTSNELEACGGCVDGYFDERMGSDRAIGIDCSTINGVALGGASCVRGRCQVTNCRKGYRLQDGHCVDSSSLP